MNNFQIYQHIAIVLNCKPANMTIQSNSSPSQSTEDASTSSNLQVPVEQKLRGCTAILITGTPMALMVPDGIDVGEYLCDLLPILDKLFEFDPFNNQSYLQRIEIDNNRVFESSEHDKGQANVMITDEMVTNKENKETLEENSDDSTNPNISRAKGAIKRPWE